MPVCGTVNQRTEVVGLCHQGNSLKHHYRERSEEAYLVNYTITKLSKLWILLVLTSLFEQMEKEFPYWIIEVTSRYLKWIENISTRFTCLVLFRIEIDWIGKPVYWLRQNGMLLVINGGNLVFFRRPNSIFGVRFFDCPVLGSQFVDLFESVLKFLENWNPRRI